MLLRMICRSNAVTSLGYDLKHRLIDPYASLVSLCWCSTAARDCSRGSRRSDTNIWHSCMSNDHNSCLEGAVTASCVHLTHCRS
jgi:hypothetical protein